MMSFRSIVLLLLAAPLISTAQLHPLATSERGGGTLQGCDPSLTVEFTANILGSYAYRFDAVIDQGNTYVVNSTWSYLAGSFQESTGAELLTYFPGPGEYPVCLTVNALDAGTFEPCSTSTCMLIDALPDSSCLDLDPDFTLGLISGATITFQDLTTFADQSFSTSWSFDDGAAVAGQQVTHTFDGVGPHRICITVTSGAPGYCSATLCKWLYLGPGDAACELFLDPGFLHVSSGQLVGVLDTSVTSGLEHEITWDFGDGSTSQGRVAVHAYEAPGNFSLCRTLRMWGAMLNDTCLTTECVEINASSAVGLDDVVVKDNWRVWPVPFHTQLVLEGPVNDGSVLTLFDVGGRTVHQHRVVRGGQRTVLDLGHLQAGAYLLEVRSQAAVHTHRVVKE
jgi:PKD repeat protein